MCDKICRTCGFPKDMDRVPVILSNDIFSIIHYEENRCEECGHQKDGSTIRVVYEFWQKLVNNIKREKVCDFNRLREIVKIAKQLDWVYPPILHSYPVMQLSEVEKCMVAMNDDFELERMRKWYKDSIEMGKS